MVAAYKGSISSIVSSWGVKEPRKGIDERKKKKIRDETISNWNAPSSGQLSIITHSFITRRISDFNSDVIFLDRRKDEKKRPKDKFYSEMLGVNGKDAYAFNI